MRDLNQVVLIGRTGKDPDIKTLSGDKKVANFNIANSERYKDKDGNRQEKTSWINLVCWQKGLVGVIEQYVKKGMRLSIVGKISNRSWEDSEGNTKYITEVVVNELTILDSNKNASTDANSTGEATHAPATSLGDDDDLPF